MFPCPPAVDYTPLLRDIQLWLEGLEGSSADLAAARQLAVRRTQENTEDLGATDPESDPERHHVLSWMAGQYPGVQQRLGELEGRVQPIPEASQGLRDLLAFIEAEQVRGWVSALLLPSGFGFFSSAHCWVHVGG